MYGRKMQRKRGVSKNISIWPPCSMNIGASGDVVLPDSQDHFRSKKMFLPLTLKGIAMEMSAFIISALIAAVPAL